MLSAAFREGKGACRFLHSARRVDIKEMGLPAPSREPRMALRLPIWKRFYIHQ